MVIQASNAIVVNGTLSANGGNGTGSTYFSAKGGSGGGAGGSIWIETPQISGVGSIQANGGNSPYAGSGGGGRIVVYSDNYPAASLFQVNSGSGLAVGTPGTVFLNRVDPTASSVAVLNQPVPADGLSAGIIEVVLRDVNGAPISGKPVEVSLVSGDALSINGQPSSVGDWIDLGLTDEAGVAHGNITATTVGSRTIQARSEAETIVQQAVVEFISGYVDAGTSGITADRTTVPADETTPAIITVTARDALSNPIAGCTVILAATGSATVHQPENVTNELGQAVGSIVDSNIETILVSATIDGVTLNNQVQVSFEGADLINTVTGPSQLFPEEVRGYQISIANHGAQLAENVAFSLILPDELTLQSQTASIEPVQTGNTYSWSFGNLNGESQETISFVINLQASSTAPIGSQISFTSAVSSSTYEQNQADNEVQTQITIIEPYQFSAQLDPSNAIARVDSPALYTVTIQNQGFLAETYHLSIDGLGSQWNASFDRDVFSLQPGDSAQVLLRVQPTECLVTGSAPFSVLVTSEVGVQTLTLNGVVEAALEPQIELITPANGIASGSDDVTFSWRTQPATTGMLRYSINGQLTEIPYSEGENHLHLASDLPRDTQVQWSVFANGLCGSATSESRTFTVGRGIVFANRTPAFVIDRDYSQLVSLTVKNEDTQPHILKATIEEDYEDLIVNFTGSGSVDELIELDAGESRTLQLAIHAQDALLTDYTLTAILTADESDLKDSVRVDIHIPATFDINTHLEVTQLSEDAVTGVRTYQVRNNWEKTLTDVQISVIDPISGLPARVYLLPSISHARLTPGQTITFKMIPIFDESDLGGQASIGGSAHLAAATTSAAIPIQLSLNAGGSSRQLSSSSIGCSSGTVFAVDISNTCLSIPKADWYCTNRPDIRVPFSIPYFIQPDFLSSIGLRTNFNPQGSVSPHNMDFTFNSTFMGGLNDMVPEGNYWGSIPSYAVGDSINTAQSGSVVQNLYLNSAHPNPGHYVVASEFELSLGIQSGSAFVCASSQEQADAVAMDTFGLEPLTPSSACSANPVFAPSTYSSQPEFCSNVTNSQVYEGGPINTLTGGLDFSAQDLSIVTPAGQLQFERWYSSLATDLYTDTLGFGWTHSLDSRLIFPGDPGGENGAVLLKGQTANLYKFVNNGDGTYTTYPGICGSLVFDPSSSQYTFTDASQRKYVFNAAGQQIQRIEPSGQVLSYAYSASGPLERVEYSADLFISLAYDLSGRLESISDHAGRQVFYSYDAITGDLVSVTDVNGQNWGYEYNGPRPHLLTAAIDPALRPIEVTEYEVFDEGSPNEMVKAIRQYNGAGEMVVELDYQGFRTTKVLDAAGNEEILVFNGRDALDRTHDPNGDRAFNQYDDDFNPTQLVDKAGNTTSMAWDGLNLLSVEDATGNEVTFTYDSNSSLLTMSDPLPAGSEIRQTEYQYNDGTFPTLPTLIIDPLGKQTTYEYYHAGEAGGFPGQLKMATDPLSNTITYTYNELGQPTSITRNGMETTQYVYDILGRQVIEIDPAGRSHWTCYDSAGRVVKTVRNASGDGADPTADPCSDSYVPSTDPDQDQINATHYDLAGNLVATVDPQGRMTRMDYDAANRLVRITQNLVDPANPSASVQDRLVLAHPPAFTLASPDQNITSMTVYDEAGREVGNLEPEDYNRLSLNQVEQLLAGTIVPSWLTSYSCYDTLNRVVKTIENPSVNTPCADYTPSGQPDLDLVTQYVYDLAGNQIATIDSAGLVTRTYFDALGRMTSSVSNLKFHAITGSLPPDRTPAISTFNIRTDYIYDDIGNQIASIDPAGNLTRTYYDLANRPVTSVRNLSGQSYEITVPPARNWTDPDPYNNLRTDSFYNDAGNLIGSLDPMGRFSRVFYDGLNRQSLVTQNLPVDPADPEGSLAAWLQLSTPPAYNPAFPDQNVTSMTVYDAAGRQVGSLQPSDYNALTPAQVTDLQNGSINPSLLSSVRCYDQLDRVVRTVTNPTGDSSMPQTDPCSSSYLPSAQPDQDQTTEFRYDANGNQIAQVDPLGRITRTYYDRLGRAVAQVANLIGQALEVDSLPAFDPAYQDQNVISRTVYNAAGQAAVTIDALGRETWTCYDRIGRTVKTVQNPSVADPCSDYTPVAASDRDVITQHEYDRLSAYTVDVDPNGNRTVFEFDELGRLAEQIDPLLNSTTFGYDILGNQVELTDSRGAVTRYTYAPTGQLTAVIENYRYNEPADHQTNVQTDYSYDAAGNRVGILDGRRNPTGFVYDGLGRLLSESDALEQTTTYGYDADGRQTTLTDANGATTHFGYDELGRLETIDYPAPTADVTFRYDKAGNRLEMLDGTGTTTWVMDDLDRPVSITAPITGAVGYTYNALGQRTALTYPDSKTVTYTYDLAGRLEVVTDWAEQLTQYTYDKAGRTDQVRLPNGVVSDYTFNEGDQLTDLVHSTTSQTLASFHYEYDPNGNRIVAEENWVGAQPTAAPAAPTNLSFDQQSFQSISLSWQDNSLQEAAYEIYRSTDGSHWTLAAQLGPNVVRFTDQGLLRNVDYFYQVRAVNSLGQSEVLTGSAETGFEPVLFDPTPQEPGDPPATQSAISYTYDPLDRLTAADYDSGAFFHYSYDAAGNRTAAAALGGTTVYSYDSANRLTSADGVGYTWDANGNLLNDGANTYSYDAANRLVGLTDGVTAYSYSYNGTGDRVGQADGSATTSYTLDLAAPLSQVLADGAQTYLYGAGRLAQEATAMRAYLLGDALGSVRLVADESGTIISSKSYQPYGELSSQWGISESNYGFTGEQTDPSGLVYLRARYYDPASGRFLSRDRWAGDYQLPMSYNQWLYGYDNPQMYTDPSGLIASNEVKDADEIVSALRSFGIWIVSDWGLSPSPAPSPDGDFNSCNWKSGRWSIWDLKIVEYAVRQMSSKLEGVRSFKNLIGPVWISKTDSACGRGCTYNYFVFREIELMDRGKPAQFVPIEQLILTNAVDFDAWTVVHELGHTWDFKYSNTLSRDLERFTGGYTDIDQAYPVTCDRDSRNPGCNDAGYFFGGVPPKGSDAGFNRMEDFAESVAAYVFPVQAQYFVRLNYYNTENRELLYYEDYSTTSRYRYIDSLISGNK